MQVKMLTDVALEYGRKILIIDAKYYGRNLSIHHSLNLHRIFIYVKNNVLELKGKGYEIIRNNKPFRVCTYYSKTKCQAGRK